VVKLEESPETLPLLSFELIDGDGVMPELLPENPFWPSPRAVWFERQTCVGPMGEYSAAFPGAGAGGMGAGGAPGVGAIVGTAAGAPQPGATAPQPQLGAGAAAQPQVGAGAQPHVGAAQHPWWWWCRT
jgi:hypothetical protein